MLEKTYQTTFLKWLKHTQNSTAVYELKVARNGSLPFTAVKEHQRNALLVAKTGKLAYKIPDDSRGYKPWDCFILVRVPANVVIFFDKNFYIIDIEDFLKIEKESVRKSLTEEMLRGLSYPQVVFDL